LMIRVGNERTGQIVDAHLRVVLTRTEHTKEGMVFYRLVDVPLARERAPALSRSWTALHPITEASPLFGQTPATLAAAEAELMVTVIGIDDVSMQPVHARQDYTDKQIVWGKRHADVLSEEADGTLTLDVRKFHDMIDTEATADFPYGRTPQEPKRGRRRAR